MTMPKLPFGVFCALQFLLAFAACRTAYCPSGPFDSIVNATAWIQCNDMAQFECRTVSNPRVYSNDSAITSIQGTAGSFRRLERRAVVGTPNKYIFVFSGGPGGNGDMFARSLYRQTSLALGNNFAIHVPYRRGTGRTDYIDNYPDFPADLKLKLNQTDFSELMFHVTNEAVDIILDIKEAKAAHPSAEIYLAGFSYGTYLAQRIVAMEPDLVRGLILDGPIPAVNGTDFFYDQAYGISRANQFLEQNCRRNPFCNARSITFAEAVQFANNLENGTSTPCFDAFASLMGASAAPKAQFFYSLFSSLAFAPHIEIPSADVGKPGYDPAILEAVLNTFSGDNQRPQSVYVDLRAVIWVLINQMAQCDSSERLETFGAAMQPIGFVLKVFSEFAASLATTEAAVGTNFVTQNLVRHSEEVNYTYRDHNALREALKFGFIRLAEGAYQGELQRRAALDTLTAYDDCWANRAPSPVKSNVAFLTGLLDVNTPKHVNDRAFDELIMAQGFQKTRWNHQNGGHTIISLGWSQCSPLFIRGFVGGNATALAQYESCLASENAATLDYEFSTLSAALNVSSVWAGISPTPEIPAASPVALLAPAVSPTLKAPTKPTSPIVASARGLSALRVSSLVVLCCAAIVMIQ